MLLPLIITYVYTEDWEGLYVDGKLWCQGHSLSVKQVAEACKSGYDKFIYHELTGDWLSESDGLPKWLCDLKINEELY